MQPVRAKINSAIPAFRVLLCFFAFFAGVETSSASLPISTACPLNFFTNVASRLLSSQLNVNLTCIPIYPTNQYTPAVHRLLQVTANIYDATTTNFYPSVFRPLFWKTNVVDSTGATQTCIDIVGYQYVQEPLTPSGPPIFYSPLDVADPNIPFGLSGMTNNIYGIPWVIGVKKGLPNFNGLEIENYFYIQRQLQFNRQNADQFSAGTSFSAVAAGRGLTTNQMYLMGISNAVGMEDWNSYAENYTNPVIIFAQDTFSATISNDASYFCQINNTFITNNYPNATVVQPWYGNSWPFSASPASFIVPLGTNVFLQNLGPPNTPPSPNNLYAYCDGSGVYATNINGYTYVAPCFIPTSANPAPFMDAGTPPLPHLVMYTTNHVWAYMLDTSNPNGTYILDYVQLGGLSSSLDLNSAIADPDNTGLWSTNFYGGGNTPFGILEQFLVSAGQEAVPVPDSDGGIWVTTPVPGAGADTSPAAQAAYFEAFFSYDDEAPYNGEVLINSNLSILAPYTPTRLICQSLVYQANDPLVHYLASDLQDLPDFTNGIISQSSSLPPLRFLGHLSDRYMPWGTAGNMASVPMVDNNAFNLAYKDPLVYDADDWDFPTGQTLNASWLGQIHRGTPWQTIFLKSTNILDLFEIINFPLPPSPSGINTWQLWTGDISPADGLSSPDAASMAPVQDWRMAGLLASLFNTNNIASLFSVNNPSPDAWENLLNGMTVLTNDVSDVRLHFQPQYAAQFATLPISANSSQAAAIASAVQSARAASPGQIIANVGDLFAIPQLSDASPYLNVDPTQTQYGISDIAYEAIPDQLLPLLWEDSIGSISARGATIQFTGDDNHAYAIQASCDLVHWTAISTNCPVNGVFNFTNTATAKARFYRTVLIQ